ncbi:MAG: diguanylate cyclase [Desulfovibrio sp.]
MAILIVDDSETSRMILTTILKNVGFEDVIQASSAEEALALLGIEEFQSHPAAGRVPDNFYTTIDAILMDIIMPTMNGIEATKRIKSTAHLQDTPIIIITVKDEEESLARAFDVGATDYITKPVTKLALQARVNSVMRLKKEMDRRKSREIELERLTKELKNLSYMDGLTGLFNRRYFDKMLDQEIRRAKRGDTPLSILMADVDFFKKYNDSYGHVAGDHCLQNIAETIKSSLKRPGDCGFRYGGEEFAIILPDTDTKGAIRIAREIQTRVHTACEKAVADGSPITISFGITTASQSDYLDPEELVGKADTALYAAKKSGRDAIRTSSGDATP